ncbi:MAG TPA: DUF3592 domain-containing protein [Thermoanaerobaculia bacterium]|nr:DUF3592 domain-containing protein [Thermoanaerobaculia bacterium]
MAFDPGVAWAFLAVGAGTQVGALMLLRRPIRLMRAGGSANGVVVDSEKSMEPGHGASSAFFFDVVEFATREGRSIRVTSEVGRRVARAKGSRVRILYDPDQPHEAELATFPALWLFPVVLSAFGMPFLLAGLAALL